MSHDYASVLLVGALNELAQKSLKGICSFSEYASDPEGHKGWLVYDEKNRRVVLGALIDDLHHDIVGYYDDLFPEVKIVVEECDDETYAVAYIPTCSLTGSVVIVEDGRWYVSEY